jgi:DNA uptake protein ComE-like DNA-binding protein
VTVSSGCVISGGSWFSAFDGIMTNDASNFDIDHLVPLKEAWRSGAHAWDSDTRRAFANDLGYEHSLIAVSATSNRSKGDRDPASWLPPRTEYHCEYIYKWVQVKIRWSLSVDPLEQSRISNIALNCSIDNLALTPSAPSLIDQNHDVLAAPTTQPQQEIQTQTSGCSQMQVDINLAGLEDLKRIIHIGDARAAELIQLRPFGSIDDLIRINGIAASRLADIKSQGVACVN